MERAQTSEQETSIEIIIVAIVTSLIVVAIFGAVIYMGCFKTRTSGRSESDGQQSETDGSQKPRHRSSKKKKGTGSNPVLVKSKFMKPTNTGLWPASTSKAGSKS